MYGRFTRGSARAKGRHRILFAAVLFGLIAAAVMFASVMSGSHRDVSRGVATAAANLAATVSRDVDRNIELLDSSIQTVAERWRNPAFQTMDPSLRDAVLFDRAAASQPDVDIYVMDSDGKVRGDSMHIIPVGMSFGDRDYFRVHVLNGDVGLFVSKPFIGRVVKARTMALSRRITNADGSFGGVVVASFQMEHLAKLYQGLNLGPDGSVTLIRTDGRVITCDPYVEGNIRDTLLSNGTFETMRSNKVGSLEGPSPIDGKTRIISFHRVGDLPLIQDVEVSVDQAYAEWWHKTSLVGAILGCLGLGLVVLLVVLNAELARRVKVEAELERLVATDPLTELANRRRFDEGLDVEWRRAIREGLPLAVLMIDADRFKSYNDTYGHPAGDQLIRALAHCIAGNIRRPGDLAARYGGEEFVVLLPNTAGPGALRVAEGIRTAVLALAHPQAAAPVRIASVSIGVAAMDPMLGQLSQDLVAAADLALYRAKEDGRNRVRIASLDPSLVPTPADGLDRNPWISGGETSPARGSPGLRTDFAA